MSNVAGKPWPEADVAKLRDLVSGGAPVDAVIPYFPGRTLAAIDRRYRKMRDELGLPPRRAGNPPREHADDQNTVASDIAYMNWRRREAEAGCRMLKAAMDRYYANRASQQAA